MMRTITTCLITAMLWCSVARAADAVLLHDRSGLEPMAPSADSSANANESSGWGKMNENGSMFCPGNEQGNAAGKSGRLPSPNKRPAAKFVKSSQRASAADMASTVWLPKLPQPWATVLMALGGLTAAIVPTLLVVRWMRAGRARGSRGAGRRPRSRSSVLTASLIQAQVGGYKSVQEREREEREKSRRAA
jgi:hypothetical protein